MRRIIATEAQEQEALITWSEHYYFKLGKDGKAVYRLRDYLIAVPNGGLRPILAALAMKRQGVTQGRRISFWLSLSAAMQDYG